MAIALDASTPAAVDLTGSTATTVVTGSFSPPANSLVVIIVGLEFDAGGSAPTVTVADSGSTSYTAGPSQYDNQAGWTSQFRHFYTSAPGSITVTATRSVNTAAALFSITTLVLTGATPSAAGASASHLGASSTSVTSSITTTTQGSWLIVSATVDSTEASFTGSGGVTTQHSLSSATDTGSVMAGYAAEGAPGSKTVGWTVPSAQAFSWAAWEVLPASVPMTVQVTGFNGSGAGSQLKVFCLTGGTEAGGAQVATNQGSGGTAANWSFTPNHSTSLILFVVYDETDGASGNFTAATNNTLDDNGLQHDSFCDGHYTGAVTSGTPVTVGCSAPAVNKQQWASYEVLPSGASTPAIDATSPAVAISATNTATTASFTPPVGAVLVATASGNNSTIDGTISDTSGLGLTWTLRSHATGGGGGSTDLWTTTIPAPAALPALPGASVPGQTWLRRFHHRQFPQAGPALVPSTVVAAPVFSPTPRLRVPHRAMLGGQGLLAAGILASGIGPPPVPAPHQPPVITHPAPHRAQWRSGQGVPPNAAQQVKSPVPVLVNRRAPHRVLWHGAAGVPPNSAQQVKAPVPVLVYSRKPHRVLWSSITGVAPNARQQVPVPKTVYVRKPHGVLWRGGAGVPPAATPQPFQPKTVYVRKLHGVTWKGGTGVAPTAAPPTGAPQPFTPVTIFIRKPHRVLWSSHTGVAPNVPQQVKAPVPVLVYVRKPHRAQWAGGQGAVPAALPQPTRPNTVFVRKPHRVLWASGLGSPPPVTTGGPLQTTTPKTIFVRKPHGAIWKGGAGVPPAAAPQLTKPKTVFARVAHRVLWHTQAGSPAPTVTLGSPQPFTPKTIFVRTPHRVLWSSRTGVAPAAPLQTTKPPTVFVRKPHGVLWRAVKGQPPAAAAQTTKPPTVFYRLRHRVLWHFGAGIQAPPPPPIVSGELETSLTHQQGGSTVVSGVTAATNVSEPQATTTAVTDQQATTTKVTDPRDGTVTIVE